MKRLVLILIMAFSASAACALEMAGVSLQDKLVLDGADSQVILNGAGIRKKLFFKVYLGSLYLPQKRSNAEEVLAADEPARVQMDILYTKIEKEKLVDAWNEGFSANLTGDELNALGDRIEKFNGMFDTLVEGDRVQLDYRPGHGTMVSINGKSKGRIEGFDFHQALLKIWLGEKPVTSSLKAAMLGH